ncbi:MAG: DUF4440 domain-containing protein [Thiohalomonadaceae bacterium]
MSSDHPDKQAVWETLRRLNDAWTKGDPAELARYFHPEMVAITATDRHRLEGAAACIDGWSAFARMARIHHWREVDPLIRLYGDAAVVAYNYELACEINGHTHNLTGRDMFFFVREADRWWAVADHFSPFP